VRSGSQSASGFAQGRGAHFGPRWQTVSELLHRCRKRKMHRSTNSTILLILQRSRFPVFTAADDALCAFPHIPALYQHSGLPSPLLCLVRLTSTNHTNYFETYPTGQRMDSSSFKLFLIT